MFEQQMITAIAAQFNAQRAEILAHLDTAGIGSKSYTRKDWLQDLLDWAQAAMNFKAAIQPIVHATILQAGQSASQAVGLESSQFDPFTPAIVEYFQNRSMKVAKDVNDETEKQLRAALSQGVQDGMSSWDLTAVVEDVMGSASTIRASRIASYEVTHAQTYGDIQAWTQSGVVSGKEWRTAEDEKVCPSCRSMNGRITGLGDNYYNQGDEIVIDRPGKDTPYRLKLDYEDIQGPSLHAHCRCVLLPVMA